MSAPKGILKPSTPYVHAPPAKAGGSKLKHTLAVAQKSSKAKKARRDADGEEDDVDMNGSGGSADEDEDGSEGDDDDEEAGTDEEIERSKKGKAKATPTDDFGSTLQSLLTESTRPTKSKPVKAAKLSTSTAIDAASSTPPVGPSQDVKPPKAAKPSKQLPILSLSRAPLPPSAAESKLEQRAARALKKEKEEKEDRARVRDVVEGWSHPKAGANGELVGALEFEKGLRKTAQRGVIKLFNAILTAHKQSAENDVEIRSTKKHKEIPISGVKGFGKKDKDNVLGRGNKEELTKEGFLELVKRGTA